MRAATDLGRFCRHQVAAAAAGPWPLPIHLIRTLMGDLLDTSHSLYLVHCSVCPRSMAEAVAAIGLATGIISIVQLAGKITSESTNLVKSSSDTLPDNKRPDDLDEESAWASRSTICDQATPLPGLLRKAGRGTQNLSTPLEQPTDVMFQRSGKQVIADLVLERAGLESTLFFFLSILCKHLLRRFKHPSASSTRY